MPQEMTLNVNGKIHRIEAAPETPLLTILRNDLGLKAAKFACGTEQCGACKVIIDGYAVNSCRLPVRMMQGREITTLEGLMSDGELHPLQQAFIDQQALQCGFCTPGMIVAAKALMDRKPQPTDGEISTDLRQNLCRCGVYDRVRRAIHQAAGSKLAPAYELRPGSEVVAETVPMPESLVTNPELDTWLRFDGDETVTLFPGKVEFGQGILTAVAQIAADELDVALARMRVSPADSSHSPDEGMTVGSMSMQTSGNAVRLVAAEARQLLLAIAFEELEAPVERLVVEDGTVRDPVTGRHTTYWKLMGGKRFGRRISGTVRPKGHQGYTVVGRPVGRLDLQAKVRGEPCFIHDFELPGMVHGRVVRPPHYHARLASVDVEAVGQMPGVIKVIRDGSFLGVIAEREEQAVEAADALREKATWQGEADLPDPAGLFEHLKQQPAQSFLVVDGIPVEGDVPEIATAKGAAVTMTAAYNRPYHMHAALGASAAAARMEEGEMTVWTHSQGVYPTRARMARVLDIDEAQLRLIHVEGPGCYGHNGADDAALDAALLARALPGRPVSLKWSRADEHGWEPYGPAAAVQMEASLDAAGKILDWNHDVWGYPHFGRGPAEADRSGLIAAWHLEKSFAPPEAVPSMGRHVGVHRNADPLYAFPSRRVVKHFVAASPLRVSAQRGLGYYANVFAIESFMDELAHAANEDPVAFRLRHLQDERARAVLEAAAESASWRSVISGGDGRGQGIAIARYKNIAAYAAVVVEVEVDLDSGQIRLLRAVIAADAGQVVNPDGLSNQLEGGLVQAASWTLYEQVMFDRYGVISLDWTSYPILNMSNAPHIETVMLDRPGRPYLGSGEAAVGPTPAALANAVFHASGMRLRDIPFTPERVKAAAKELRNR